MKKVLIASTALVAAGLMTAGTASASEKIKLELGGFSKWWVVGAWNDSGYNDANNIQPVNVDVKGDNEVYFGGSTTLDNGLKVGIQVQMEAGGHTDSRSTATGTTDTIDESFVWLEGGFGKLLVGSKNNGTYLIHNTAPDAAGNWNEGGILTGDYALSRPSSVNRLGQIADDANVAGTWGVGNRTSGSGNTTAILTDGDSEGVTYVSPSFYGLAIGASYKPNGLNEDNRGFDSAAMPVYGVGALYANTFGGVGIKYDLGYATYNPEHAVKALAVTSTHGQQQEWSTGLNLSYAGFTLGGSYRQIIDNEQFGTTGLGGIAVDDTSYDGYGWDVGLQYASGPYAVSIGYFRSEVAGLVSDSDNDKIEFYQLSGKYSLGAGVDALASAGYGHYKDETANNPGVNKDTVENKGWVVMTGLSLAF